MTNKKLHSRENEPQSQKPLLLSEQDLRKILFWLQLLEPVIYNELPHGSIERYFRKLAGQAKGISVRTLWRKLALYRQGGLKALLRKERSDKGLPRAFPPEVIQKAIELKRDQPRRSYLMINPVLKDLFQVTVPRSTMYRHLKRAGATRKLLGYTELKVRRRWGRDHTHDLWQGDFEHGPFVLKDTEVAKSKLCVFVDAYSRYPIAARYYYNEDLAALSDCFLLALDAHGAPRELYVDGAKIYHSKAFECACFELKIKLHTRPPRDPQAGGLVEKFIQTVQSQFESEVLSGELLTLEELNEALSAYLNLIYIKNPNAETGQSPEERYKQGLLSVRRVDVAQVALLFMRTEQRTVHKDFSDIQLRGRFFRVDPKLRGERLLVCYDPFGPLKTVYLFSLQGEYLGEGHLHDRTEGGPTKPPQARKSNFNYLHFLVTRYREALKQQSRGIDYVKATCPKTIPFTRFASTVAKLLGREGELSSFTERELKLLHEVYKRLPTVNRTVLREVISKAPEKTFPEVLYQLQRFARTKEV